MRLESYKVTRTAVAAVVVAVVTLAAVVVVVVVGTELITREILAAASRHRHNESVSG